MSEVLDENGFLNEEGAKFILGLIRPLDLKLQTVDYQANKTVVDTALDPESTNPLQNKVIAAELKKYSPAGEIAEKAKQIYIGTSEVYGSIDWSEFLDQPSYLLGGNNAEKIQIFNPSKLHVEQADKVTVNRETSASFRNVWFSSNEDPSKLVHDTSFQYNPNTKELKVDSITGSSASCTGNAASATKAIQDGSGNVISSNYATVATVNTLSSTVSGHTTSIAGKAPTSHASTATTYGAGNGSNYGHVKLSDTYNSNVGNAANSIAASQTALYNAYTALNTSIGTKASNTIYGDAFISLGRKASTSVGTNSIAYGYDITASSAYSQAFGYSTTASGTNGAHAEGYGTAASGNSSHAEGRNTTASGPSGCHAEGNSTTARFGMGAHAEGYYTSASSNGGHAEGYCTIENAESDGSHAEGYYTTASGDYGAHAEGYYTTASGTYGAHAEGHFTTASGANGAHAEGTSTRSIATAVSGYTASTTASTITAAWTSKKFSVAHGTSSHVEGTDCLALSSSAHAEGYCTQVDGYGSGSHAEGYFTRSQYGEGVHAEGYKTSASSNGGHAEGYNTSESAFSNGCHAEGYYTTAFGINGSHAEGYYTTASGSYGAHAEGFYATASGENGSHAEGYYTTASGEDGAHAEGSNTTASGTSAHAEGYYTTAGGANGSHAEGYSSNRITSYVSGYTASTSDSTITTAWSNATDKFSVAHGESSHVEGIDCLALGSYSHAEGYRTQAASSTSHAEGRSTKASASYSHAEGYGSITSAVGSHAGGYYTTASNYASTAIGKYNKAMTTGGAYNTKVGDVFVVGNGTSSTALSNAMRVTYAGAVYGLSAFNASGADYAEFIYEWEDGNQNNEDRVGYFVTFKDKKITKAKSSDIIIGITSGNPSVVGNADEDYYWKYERDEFNRVVWEDVEEVIEEIDPNTGSVSYIKTGKIIPNGRMKISADYDSSKQDSYVERKDRKEWDYVGMKGVLHTRDDGTCIPGGFCKCNDEGIATFATPEEFNMSKFSYIVLERVSDHVIKVLL